MHSAAGILLSLFVVFVAARIGDELAQRMRMPGVVGEIVAGALLGPSLLNWVHPGVVLDALAEVGVVFLLFAVGLETRLADLKRVGLIAFLVGTLGVIVPFGGASLWAHLEGFAWNKSMFIAAAFVATSAGITARVLQEMHALQRREAHVILGAAVIDDILAMLLLGVVVSMQDSGVADPVHLLIVVAEAVGFVVVVGWLGTRVARRRSAWLERPRMTMSALSIVLALCLGLAWLSTRFGLAAIIGAFLAGLIASETDQREQLEHQMRPLLTLLTPFFFVMTGVKLDVRVFLNPDALIMLSIATLLAVVTKWLGAYLGSLKLGHRSAMAVGIGMVPRGEVGVVVASLGLAAGVFSAEVYAVIVAMSLLTSILTPPLLGWMLRRAQREEDNQPAS
ncbi:MAG: cation:proton antiporter [Metallibacterium scheffleri]|jgi:Kef-type K+ transport system membrane component KefB|uniref:cation:proton antiporter n=1 Tax=Metallibacterium scheffleri TaxID=993689 RepID=UPI0026F22E8D|nr:cation:proton antiporter [Metallibacterium scheffleri]MCK9365722.1 cation:proton antiporter [Metallibacterium scheffleri]